MMPTGIGGEIAGWCPTFTGDSTDWVGSEDGTLENGAAIITNTDNGGTKAFLFDGVDDYMSVPNPSVLTSLSAVTFSAWVRWDALATHTDYAYILSQDSVGSNRVFDLGRGGFTAGNDNKVYGVVWNSAGSLVEVRGGAYVQSVWTHVCMTWDGVTVKLFQDTSLVASKSLTGPLRDKSVDMYMGRFGGGLNYWNGLIDDARIFNVAISSAELANLASKRGYEPAAAGNPSQLINGGLLNMGLINAGLIQ